MKKLLLGLAVAGIYSASAFAANCSVSDIVAGDWGDFENPYATAEGTDAEKAAQFEKDAEGGAGTVSAATTAVTTAIAAQVNPANAISMGGAGLARTDSISSSAAMAAVDAYGYDCGWELWVNPFAVWANDDARGLYTGYDADIYGVNLGVGKKFGNFKVGAFFGYAGADIDADEGYMSYDSDHYTVGLYANTEIRKFVIDVAAGYSWININDYKFDAGLLGGRTNAGDRDGDSYFANIKLGYNFELGNCWTITPSVGFEYVNTHIDSYEYTTMNNALPLLHRVGKAKGHSSRLPFLLRVQRQFGSARVFVRGGYIRELYTARQSVGYWNAAGNQTSVRSAKRPDESYGTAGAGIDYSFGRFDLGLAYDYQWSDKDEEAHILNAMFRITF